MIGDEDNDDDCIHSNNTAWCHVSLSWNLSKCVRTRVSVCCPGVLLKGESDTGGICGVDLSAKNTSVLIACGVFVYLSQNHTLRTSRNPYEVKPFVRSGFFFNKCA